MNGPDHYREAERYLARAGREQERHRDPFLLAAQVHATLALAAATATHLTGQFLELDEDAFAWSEVSGTPPRGIEDIHLPEMTA